MAQKILILIAALVLAACNSYKSKLHPEDEGDSNNVTSAAIDYAFVNAKIFQPKCVRCHSSAGGNKGDVNLEAYDSVVSHLADIKKAALVERSMPPKRAGGALPASDQNILKMWIDAGAPLNAEEPGPAPTPTATPEQKPTPSPTPEVSPTPVTGQPPAQPPTQPPQPPVVTPEPTPFVVVDPTWDSISKNIFQPKCVKCHQAGEKAEDYALTDRAFVVDENNDILVAGDPDNSNLYKAITRTDKKMMPPARTGITLSDQEKDAIRVWILNGAKD